MPNDEWERIIKVNTMQHVFVARHLFPLFEERGAGKLVITASAAGLLTQVGSLPYSVTKHAAVSVAEWLAITYADKGISVHCLCPQAVNTGMMPSNDDDDDDVPDAVPGADGGVAGGDGVLQPKEVS